MGGYFVFYTPRSASFRQKLRQDVVTNRLAQLLPSNSANCGLDSCRQYGYALSLRFLFSLAFRILPLNRAIGPPKTPIPPNMARLMMQCSPSSRPPSRILSSSSSKAPSSLSRKTKTRLPSLTPHPNLVTRLPSMPALSGKSPFFVYAYNVRTETFSSASDGNTSLNTSYYNYQTSAKITNAFFNSLAGGQVSFNLSA